jgi:hypothetical protein
MAQRSSPRDFIARAGNGVDISAAKKDVRIKAERHLHALCGNDNIGSMLLECKGQGDPGKSDWDEIGDDVKSKGIQIIGLDTDVNIHGQNLYAGIGGDGRVGEVAIDAGEGQLLLAGGEVDVEGLNQFNVLVGIERSETEEPPVLSINSSGSMLNTSLQLGGDLLLGPYKGGGNILAASSLQVKGPILCESAVLANQHFASLAGGHVSQLEDPVSIDPQPSEVRERIANQTDGIKTNVYSPLDMSIFEDDEFGPAHTDFYNAIGFSFRKTEEHLKLTEDDFILYESPWQQIYRVKGVETVWDEPIVVAPTGEDTRPHPGQKGWQNFKAFATVDVSDNFDIDKGRATNREQEKDGKEPEKKTLEEGYVINVQ